MLNIIIDSVGNLTPDGRVSDEQVVAVSGSLMALSGHKALVYRTFTDVVVRVPCRDADEATNLVKRIRGD